MKTFIILSVLLLTTTSIDTLDQSMTCECYQLLTQHDCQTATNCQWGPKAIDVNVYSCTPKKVETVVAITSYCETLSKDPSACSASKGCAFYTAQCTHFTGCTSYPKTTNEECQDISVQCTTDGQTCITTRPCSEYQSQLMCMNVSNSGTKICVWNGSVCRDQQCSDLSTELITDSQCNTVLSGCVTNGKGCVLPPRPACSTYSGSQFICSLYIGTDGGCDGDGTKCHSRKCVNASQIYRTDSECNQYKSGCVTNGKGCTDVRYPCQTYIGTTATCSDYIGSDGYCKGSSSLPNCVAKECIEAPTQYASNSECNQYQIGCITNGKGCVKQLSECFTYKGTSVTCEGYIGSDGNCRGIDNTIQSCVPRVCSEASIKYTTNIECTTFQKGCVTNGQGCIVASICENTVLQDSCNGTTGCDWQSHCVDVSSCSSINTMGLCQAQRSSTMNCIWEQNTCRDMKCQDAPIGYNTDIKCNQFMINCVSNGVGCVNITDDCSNYNGTQIQCSKYSRKCWNSNDAIETTKCFNRLCQFDITSTTNAQCIEFLSTCVTKGVGCIESSAPCSSYSGTLTQCSQFKGENNKYTCYNTITATQNTACYNKQCNDNITGMNNAECEQFMSGCVFNGQKGCIPKNSPCSMFMGNQVICAELIGNSKLCWNTNEVVSNCIDRQCIHAPITLNSDIQCNTFLTGCVTTNKGCIQSTASCSQYSGTTTQCDKFIGNSIKCTRKSKCGNRQCSDLTNVISIVQCSDYLNTCTKLGQICVTMNQCSQYTGTPSECKLAIGTDGVCWSTSEDPLKSACILKQCNMMVSPTSQSDCTTFMNGCRFSQPSTGNVCMNVTTTCSQLSGINKTCNQLIGSDGPCWSTDTNNCTLKTCSHYLNPTESKQCSDFKQGCLLSSPISGKICMDSTTLCNQLHGTNEYCQTTTANDGPCWSQSNDTACVLKTCNMVSQPLNQSYCGSCLFSRVSNSSTLCMNKTTNCSGLSGYPGDCDKYVANDGQCYYQLNNILTPQPCIKRECNHKLNPTSTMDCTQFMSSCMISYTATNKVCVSMNSLCNQLSGTSIQCQTLIGSDGPCWPSINSPNYQNCTLKTCNLLINPKSLNDCSTFRIGCRFSKSVDRCLEQSTLCSGLSGLPQDCQLWNGSDGRCWSLNTVLAPCILKSSLKCQNFNGNATYCQQLIQSDGPCWQSDDTNTCRVRVCTDDKVSGTDSQCNAHLTGCKTNGTGCVDSNTDCTILIGTQYTCPLYTSSVANVKCKFITMESDVGQCADWNCYDDTVSTINTQCQPGCLTKGVGCLPSKSECNQYQGTQIKCSTFIGNGKPCWNDINATDQSFCRIKLCKDNLISTTDSQCNTFLQGCVTNNHGCIDPELPCSFYRGTKVQCAKFNANKGTKPCWNTNEATEITECIDRTCSLHSGGTTDAECAAFIPSNTVDPICVTDGKRCVNYPRVCSQYSGTDNECNGFKASDGPCMGDSNGMCAQRQCKYAPNFYNTDQICKEYHKTCVTNGYGCQLKATCKDMATQQSCIVKSGCKWQSTCSTTKQQCNQLTSLSLCVNSTVTNGRCGWKDSLCHSQTCEDLSTSIQTDESCSSQLSQCTTNGQGCIIKGTCDSYTTQNICLIAKTTQPGNTCVWDSIYNKCRAKQCSDARLLSDDACYSFLNGCITNGVACIDKGSSCQSIKLQSNCVKDPSCLWFNSECVNYQKCEDIKGTTVSYCQSVSPQCTTNGINCIPLLRCNQFSLKVSCIIGTDGDCSWLPTTGDFASQCVRYTKCTDLESSNQSICQQFNSKCITNGTTCITISMCETYMTMIPCQNTTSCYWDEMTQTPYCRNKQCQDATYQNSSNIKSHSGCNSFSSQCTTDGTNCVQLQLCESYSKIESCVIGTNGSCIFSYEVGNSSGVQSCRVKKCQDYKNIVDSSSCTKDGAGELCIHDGNNCVQKSVCSSYTTVTSCSQGGTDGICVFSTGQCKLMTACQDASSDQAKCIQKSNVCQWTSNSCVPHTCESYNTGSSCAGITDFTGNAYTVCAKVDGKCVQSTINALLESECYLSSHGTHIWNNKTLVCESCSNITSHQILQGTLSILICMWMI